MIVILCKCVQKCFLKSTQKIAKQIENFKISEKKSYIIYLSRVLCLSLCHNCGTLSYSFNFSNQTDQGDQTEGLKREGLEMER
jgi:hypothetical protein